MNIRLASDPIESIVDGEGYRLAIFVQGCSRNCRGCHNPESHDPKGGFDIDIDELIEQISRNTLISGITLTGGEPLEQPDACLELVRKARDKRPDLNIWLYTGYSIDDLSSYLLPLTQSVDVIVDGAYIEEERSLELKFRGSKNQRIIKVRNDAE